MLSFFKPAVPEDWLQQLKSKNFKWDQESVKQLHFWVKDKRAKEQDIPVSSIIKGISLNHAFWDQIDIWWRRYPLQFKSYWNYIKQHPRLPWSPSALSILDRFVDDKKTLIDIALLNDEGRFWLLEHELYNKELKNVDDQTLESWVVSTTHSMQNLNKSFHTLVLLNKKGNIEHHRIAKALANVFLKVENAEDKNSLPVKAWLLNNKDLETWMDEDKELPWWFDPVNRDSWIAECKEWCREVKFKIPKDHILFNILVNEN